MREQAAPAGGAKAKGPSAAGQPRPSPRLLIGICLALALATIAVYAQVHRFGFIAYDDDQYVYRNPELRAGVTPTSIAWAFTTFRCANWHPLTWVSHIVDCELFGVEAGGHHLVNLGLHVANTLLLFLAFGWMTGRLWRSAVVAGVFALHPLHVESVAWVAERKDVLSTFLGLIALLFYVWYSRKRTIGRYALVVLFFGLGLMAKPMLVTLPFVLLLVDVWPLGRAEWPPTMRSLKPLVVEKLPLLLMVVVASVVTVIAQKSSGAVQSLANLSPTERIGNACIGYVSYMGKAVWPAGLGVLYPIGEIRLEDAVGSAVILVGVTVAALLVGRRRPYVLVGWLWYIGMLVPVIGIVQVGAQSIADRYTYVPLVGLAIGVVWLVGDLVEGRGWLQRAAVVVGGVVLAALGVQAHRQAGYWESSRTLFEHTLAVTEKNAFMHNNLGAALVLEFRPDEAIAHYRQAVAIDPNYAEAHNNLGMALAQQGKAEEAAAHYRAALAIRPKYAEAYNNLGAAIAQMGRFDEAMAFYRQSLANDPDYAEAHANVGHELLRLGKFDEAYGHLTKAVETLAHRPEVQADLGTLLAAQGKLEESRVHLEESLRLAPEQPNIQSNLGFVLERLGRREEAMSHYAEALRLNPGHAAARAALERLRGEK